MYLNQGQLSSGGNKLLPETTNLTSWLTTPTTDGKTVSNNQGTTANLTGINCIQFTSGGAADYIDLQNTITTTSAWELECDIMWTNFGSANSGVAFLSSDDSSKEFIRINGADGDNLFFEGKLGGTQFREYALSFSLALNTAYRLKVAVSGVSITLSINGVAQQIIVWGNNANSNVFGSIGRPIAVQGTAKIANWKLSSGGVVLAHLPIQEGSGTKCFDVSGNGNHGIIANSTWTTADGFVSHNALYGHSLVGVLNGTVSGFDTDFDGDELDMYEIKMQSTSDVGGDGNSYFVEASHTNPTLFMTNSVEGSGRRMSFRIPTDTSVANGIVSLSGVSSADFNVYKVDYTNTSAVKVFVNGELVLTDSRTVVPTNAHFHIGNDNSTNASDNGFFYHFKGWKDGVLKIHVVPNVDGRLIDLISGNLLPADVGGTGSLGVRRFPALINKTTQVVTLDGVNDGIDTNYYPAGDLVIDCRVRLDSFSGDTVIHSCNSISGYYFGVNNGEWQLYVGGGGSSGFVINGAADSSPDSTTLIFDTRLEFVDSTNTWTAYAKTSTQTEYTLLGTGTRTPNFTEATVLLGQRGTSNYLNGEIHSFKLTSNGVTKIEYDFNPTGTNTILDISGNQNGTASNITTDLFWGKRIIDSSGSIVSADYANGNTTIRNPSGILHNQSEVGFDLVTTDKSASNISSLTNASETQDFARKDSNGNVIHYLQYSSAISDSTSLTRTRNYVG